MIVDIFRIPVTVQPDISMTGLLKLISFVEGDIQKALVQESFYHTRGPDDLYKKEILQSVVHLSLNVISLFCILL